MWMNKITSLLCLHDYVIYMQFALFMKSRCAIDKHAVLYVWSPQKCVSCK